MSGRDVWAGAALTGEDRKTLAREDAAPVVTGYVCKRCDGPAPVGVGYAGVYVPLTVAVMAVTSCPCGYSTRAVA